MSGKLLFMFREHRSHTDRQIIFHLWIPSWVSRDMWSLGLSSCLERTNKYPSPQYNVQYSGKVSIQFVTWWSPLTPLLSLRLLHMLYSHLKRRFQIFKNSAPKWLTVGMETSQEGNPLSPYDRTGEPSCDTVIQHMIVLQPFKDFSLFCRGCYDNILFLFVWDFFFLNNVI